MSVGVAAKRVDDIDTVDVAPGAFEFYDTNKRRDAGMIYACPCGCGRRGALAFKPEPSPSWNWNGDREWPSLTPSVHHKINGQTHWHGYLTAGRWMPC